MALERGEDMMDDLTRRVFAAYYRTEGDAKGVLDHDALLGENDWLMREVRHYLKRVLKRVIIG